MPARSPTRVRGYSCRQTGNGLYDMAGMRGSGLGLVWDAIEYVRVLVEENSSGSRPSHAEAEPPAANRLYGVDQRPSFPVAEVIWDADEKAHPQLALLAALARDPLLRATAAVVFGEKPE